MEDSDEATGTCSLKLFPEENSWHYITVTPTRPDRKIEFAINVIITGMKKQKQLSSQTQNRIRIGLKYGSKCISQPLSDCPHPVSENINYLLVNKFNPHEVCTEMTRNSRSSISLLFPPYQVF